MGKKNNRHGKHQGKPGREQKLSKERDRNELIDDLLKLTTQTANSNVTKEFETFKEIYEVLEKINLLEGKENAKSDRCDETVLRRFESWLKENGAIFEGVSIKEFPGYDLGLKAEMDIEEASLIIAVPRKLMLSVENANGSILKSLISKDKILQNMPNVVLAIFLLIEKFSGDSFWKPYFDVLPSTYSTVLYFNLDELEALTASPTFKGALNQIKNIARQYAYFQKIVSTAKEPACETLRKRFTYKEYCWAVSTIMTRQNTIPTVDGKERVNALIPLWDMCNHTNGNISTDYNPELNRCECLAVKNFKSGEQLFIFYGPRTNANLFIHNGFVYDDNEFDYYPLSLGVSQSDSLRDKRLNLLRKLSIDPALPFKLKKEAPPIDGELLAFLRIFNMNEEQLDHWLDSNKGDDLTYGDCALETVLEKKTWTFLQMRIKILLAAYRTSLEDDENELKGEMTENKRLAIKMKMSEKRILRCVLEYVEQCIKQFD